MTVLGYLTYYLIIGSVFDGENVLSMFMSYLNAIYCQMSTTMLQFRVLVDMVHVVSNIVNTWGSYEIFGMLRMLLPCGNKSPMTGGYVLS